MTEPCWYYRTHFAFPVWVNNELNGNWQNVVIHKAEAAARKIDDRQHAGSQCQEYQEF